MQKLKNGDKVRFKRTDNPKGTKFWDETIPYEEVGVIVDVYTDMVVTCSVRFDYLDRVILCRKDDLIKIR